MKREDTEQLADARSDASQSKGLPLPRKAAASIVGLPAGTRGGDLPKEFVRTLKRTMHNVGTETVLDLARIYSPLRDRVAVGPKARLLTDELDQVRKVLDEITRDNPTFSATVPIILQAPGPRTPEVIGSGVLLRIVDRTFLLTAAHVTDRQSDGTLLIPGNQGFMPATGYFSAMRLPASGNRANDKLDVAYFLLDEHCTNQLHSECTILDRQDVLLEANPSLCTDYTFAGYPWRKSRAKDDAIETPFITFTGVEAKRTDYEALGLSRSRHIAIRFHRRRSYSQRLSRVITSPLPQGVSGGGVFAWGQEALKEWPVRLPLAGIATEFIPDRSLFVATRLHVFVRCIFHNHPDLASLAQG